MKNDTINKIRKKRDIKSSILLTTVNIVKKESLKLSIKKSKLKNPNVVTK
ncbi:MAG: hypothetical protein PHW42_01245 [Patescibacteria group bacterium]|nr:hypothetical protein [Patescibacteria group bacterium]